MPPSSTLSWTGDDETDRSYDSSQLQPSPSIMSVAILEDSGRLHETAFLRPSGSAIASSVNILSTSLLSPSRLLTTSLSRPTSSAPRSSKSPSSLALRQSSPPSSSSITHSTKTTLSSSVALSSPSPPLLESLSPSSPTSLPFHAESIIEEESAVVRAPRTISTLLDTARASSRSAPVPTRPLTPVPIPQITHTTQPEGTTVTNVLPRYDSAGREQASLRPRPQRPLPPTPRDFALELNRLAEDFRGYNDVRSQENRQIVGDVQALRDELRNLSEYRRAARPPDVVRIVEPPIAPSLRRMESRGAGSSTEIQMLNYPRPERASGSVGAAPTRASSTTSVESFLSSHHSDDLSLYGYTAFSVPSTSDMETEFEDESSFVSSSEIIESEITSSTPARFIPPAPTPYPHITPMSSTRSSSYPPRTARSVPLVFDDWAAPLNAIREQLNDLASKQTAILRNIDTFRVPKYPEIPAMRDKIGLIEDLVSNLSQKFENHQPLVTVAPVPIYRPILVQPEPRPPSRVATVHDLLPSRGTTARDNSVHGNNTR